MTFAADRREMGALVDSATAGSARQGAACAELGLDARTLQRWACPEGALRAGPPPFRRAPRPG